MFQVAAEKPIGDHIAFARQRISMLMRRAALLAVFAAACDGTGSDGSTHVAQAALTVAPNKVSCSSPAPKAFDGAGVCVCGDLKLVGSGLTVSCHEGTKTNVGVNGATQAVGEYKIDGSLVSWKDVQDVGQIDVTQNLTIAAGFSGVGSASVGGDLSVGGQLSSVGELKVTGATRTVANGKYVAPAAPPCDCTNLIDVKALVTAASSTATKLTADAVGELTLDLAGDAYFINDVSSVGDLKIHVSKPSALYINGDLKTVGTDSIDVDENASLDLYVAGNIENVGEWKVSDTTLAGVVRLYVGGQGSQLSSVGSKTFVGSIYAPQTSFDLVGDTSIRGALFAGSISGVGHLSVDFARQAEPTAAQCQ
jgi:hypothetical protein